MGLGFRGARGKWIRVYGARGEWVWGLGVPEANGIRVYGVRGEWV
jgi:hypothetical protein